MLLACALNALLLSTTGTVSLAPSPAPAAQKAPESRVLGSKDERAAQASDYYAKGRYVEAALEFEGLWRDFPGEPRFLFNAAASRYIAGHYAHAVAYLGEYLARSEIQGDDRKEAQAQLDEARRKVAGVRVAVTVPAGAQGEVNLTVEHVARGASDIRPAIKMPARRGARGVEAVVQLEPGSWVVRAQGDGYAPAEGRVEVKGLAGQDVALQLAAAPVAAGAGEPTAPIVPGEAGVPAAVRQRLKIGVAATGGVSAALGVVLVAVGTVKNSAAANCTTKGECWDPLAGSLRMRAAGAGLIGGGVGLIAGGLTWISADPRTRRKAWIAEAAIGGAALVGGAVWMYMSLGDINTSKEPSWTNFYNEHHVKAQHAAGAAVLGLGAGLLTSSITGLLVQHKYRGNGKRTALRTLRLDGSAAPGRAGLVLSGRF